MASSGPTEQCGWTCSTGYTGGLANVDTGREGWTARHTGGHSEGGASYSIVDFQVLVRKISRRCLAEYNADPKKGGKACFAPPAALFEAGLSQAIALEIGDLVTACEGSRTHTRTHARTHACRHARTHARTHARRQARMHACFEALLLIHSGEQ